MDPAEDWDLIIRREGHDAAALSAVVSPPRLADGSNIQVEWADNEPGDQELEAIIYRRLADFDMKQYRSYIDKVRRSGIEPKDLNSVAGLPESGPGAPDDNFWCLVAVRDRFIFHSDKLKSMARDEVAQAEIRLGQACGLLGFGAIALGAAAIPALHIPGFGAAIAALLSAGPAALFGLRREAAKSSMRRLDMVIEQARSWELDESGEGDGGNQRLDRGWLVSLWDS